MAPSIGLAFRSPFEILPWLLSMDLAVSIKYVFSSAKLFLVIATKMNLEHTLRSVGSSSLNG